LVFEHDPAAIRLDQFLAQHLRDLEHSRIGWNR
jgi:hypothetical protein